MVSNFSHLEKHSEKEMQYLQNRRSRVLHRPTPSNPLDLFQERIRFVRCNSFGFMFKGVYQVPRDVPRSDTRRKQKEEYQRSARSAIHSEESITCGHQFGQLLVVECGEQCEHTSLDLPQV